MRSHRDIHSSEGGALQVSTAPESASRAGGLCVADLCSHGKWTSWASPTCVCCSCFVPTTEPRVKTTREKKLVMEPNKGYADPNVMLIVTPQPSPSYHEHLFCAVCVEPVSRFWSLRRFATSTFEASFPSPRIEASRTSVSKYLTEYSQREAEQRISSEILPMRCHLRCSLAKTETFTHDSLWYRAVASEACRLCALQDFDPHDYLRFCLRPFIVGLIAVGRQPFGLVTKETVSVSSVFAFAFLFSWQQRAGHCTLQQPPAKKSGTSTAQRPPLQSTTAGPRAKVSVLAIKFWVLLLRLARALCQSPWPKCYGHSSRHQAFFANEIVISTRGLARLGLRLRRVLPINSSLHFVHEHKGATSPETFGTSSRKRGSRPLPPAFAPSCFGTAATKRLMEPTAEVRPVGPFVHWCLDLCSLKKRVFFEGHKFVCKLTPRRLGQVRVQLKHAAFETTEPTTTPSWPI